MSMPSDVTSDVTEAMQRKSPARLGRASRSLLKQVTPEQAGLAAAVVVAFLGVGVIGPRFAEARRPRSLSEKTRLKAHDARRDAEAAGRKARKRVRELGGTVRF